ncbi:MAG: right-handed parallel beta-helix repeat-containing protein [candidate division WOR-3 bacterium]|nr:MAG: right-handed parallel beta-helix repeat-containing protein [candidate division WOR-3 bacterium]
MKKCMLRMTLLGMLCLFSIGSAEILYVHPDSSLNSIQVALDSCFAYDTVLAGPGIYYENIIWPYVQGINLLSEFGADTTIIDGGKESGVIHLSLMPEDSVTLIKGFTIRNGDAWQGGGIYSVGGRPRITGNIITDNTSQWQSRKSHLSAGYEYRDAHTRSSPERSKNGPPPQGGGIYTEWSSAVIINNVISGNISHQGGGVACFCDAANISPLIMNNTITANTAHAGGGVYIDCPFTMTVVRENMISDNTANFGGGFGCYYVINPLLRITDNTITGNSADSAGGGIWCYLASRPIIDSNTVSGNTGDGIYIGYNSSPLVTYNNIVDNVGLALVNDDADELIMAENNWWGDASGPYHPMTNPGGMGDTVSDYVDYDPWMTLPGTGEHLLQSQSMSILQIHPNPFSDIVSIRYLVLDTGCLVKNPTLKIYDVGGRIVNDFGHLSDIGYPSSMKWYGTDSNGKQLPGGVYFLKLKVGKYSETAKIVLLR